MKKMLAMVNKAEARRRYVAGEKVYLGIYTKRDGGAWSDLAQFTRDVKGYYAGNNHTAEYFDAANRYFARLNRHSRTRYAVEFYTEKEA